MTVAVVEAAASSAAALVVEDLAAALEADLVEGSGEVRVVEDPVEAVDLPAGLADLEAVEAVLLRTVTISLRIGVDPITINGIGFKPIFNWPINRGDFKCASIPRGARAGHTTSQQDATITAMARSMIGPRVFSETLAMVRRTTT